MPDDAVRPVKFHAYPKSSGIVLRMIHQEINEIYGESDGGGGCGSPRGEAAEFGPLIAVADVPRFHCPQGGVSDARRQRPQFDLLSETQNRFRHSIKPVITRIPGRSWRAAREPEPDGRPAFEESDPLVGPGRRVCRRALHCSGLWPMRLTLAEAKSASG